METSITSKLASLKYKEKFLKEEEKLNLLKNILKNYFLKIKATKDVEIFNNSMLIRFKKGKEVIIFKKGKTFVFSYGKVSFTGRSITNFFMRIYNYFKDLMQKNYKNNLNNFAKTNILKFLNLIGIKKNNSDLKVRSKKPFSGSIRVHNIFDITANNRICMIKFNEELDKNLKDKIADYLYKNARYIFGLDFKDHHFRFMDVNKKLVKVIKDIDTEIFFAKKYLEGKSFLDIVRELA